MQFPEFRRRIEARVKELLDLMEAKNHDYSGGEDVFANFRTSEAYGVPPEIGIIMRMGDKFQRINTFLQNGSLKVAGEGVKDAGMDTIGYAFLLLGMIEERLDEADAFVAGEDLAVNASVCFHPGNASVLFHSGVDGDEPEWFPLGQVVEMEIKGTEIVPYVDPTNPE